MNVVEYHAGDRSANDVGYRQGRQEQRSSLCHVTLTEPVGEVENNSRKVSGFGESKQESHYVELVDVRYETCEGGNQSPTEQNARDPDASTDLVQKVIARNFEEKISEEEDATQKAELLAGDRQFPVHGQGGEANVDPVDEGNDKDHEEKRNEAHAYLADDGFEGVSEGGSGGR